MGSDLKYLDVFRYPKWILDNLLSRYKVIRLPPNAGWYVSNAGSGGVGMRPSTFFPYTGTTASSRGMGYDNITGLNSGNLRYFYVDWGKRLEIRFLLYRQNSDPEAVGHVQLKSVSAEGDLTGLGVGLRIDNYAVTGEAYGTARATLSLGTLSDSQIWRVKIVHVPANRVEFYVNEAYVGALTGSAVPSGSSPAIFVASIINGATGGVNAILGLGDITLIQEW